MPVGQLTGQVGDWEPENGMNKAALLSGRVVAAGPLPAAPQPTGQVVWDDGTTQTVQLISADDALHNLVSADAGGCPECQPLQVTGARLNTATIQTTRGKASVPAWEYTVKGTAVRVTQVAVAGSAAVTVTPLSWDPYNPPAGLSIESATTTAGSRQLTVAFTGAPRPRSEPCGVDYSTEAVESAHAVVVIVIAHPHAANETCALIGARRTADANLAKPLGERVVLEVKQGLPVPVTRTA